MSDAETVALLVRHAQTLQASIAVQIEAQQAQMAAQRQKIDAALAKLEALPAKLGGEVFAGEESSFSFRRIDPLRRLEVCERARGNPNLPVAGQHHPSSGAAQFRKILVRAVVDRSGRGLSRCGGAERRCQTPFNRATAACGRDWNGVGVRVAIGYIKGLEKWEQADDGGEVDGLGREEAC